MDCQKKIEEFIYDYPVLEFYLLKPEDLTFSPKVRYICEKECDHYGHSWACPPSIGAIGECIKKCQAFQHVFLFSTVAEVPNLDFSASLEAKKAHEKTTLALRERFRQAFGPVLALSTGCMLCETCTYPSSPCRHPEKRLSTIESHGILIMKTVESIGMCFDCGNDMVTYFSLIFFHES